MLETSLRAGASQRRKLILNHGEGQRIKLRRPLTETQLLSTLIRA